MHTIFSLPLKKVYGWISIHSAMLFITLAVKTAYMICRSQGKMKMRGPLLDIIKNFKTVTVGH